MSESLEKLKAAMENAGNGCGSYGVQSVDEYVSALDDRIAELERKLVGAQEIVQAIQPGTPEAFVEGLFMLAEKHGRSGTRSDSPLDYLNKKLTALQARERKLYPYLHHAPECARTDSLYNAAEPGAVCDCGLTAALKQEGE